MGCIDSLSLICAVFVCACIGLGLEDTHSAISDLDVDAEILSMAPSTDDASKPCANSLLCKAAFAGSIPHMLRALGLGASPNWNCKAEEGKTPLIRAIESVSCLEFSLKQHLYP